MEESVTASDGIRARVNGAWAKQKLRFLDEFGPPALAITRKKTQRVFIDLFAGPGLNVTDTGGEEVEGSSIRALAMRAPGRTGTPFTHAHLVNLEVPDRDALEARVGRLYTAQRGLVQRQNVCLHLGDANQLIPRIMGGIPRTAYVFVIADLEAPSQWPWTSVEALKAMGHVSVDLYMLFPLEMGVNRLISIRNDEHTEMHAPNLTAFFGTDQWRAICRRRSSSAQSPHFRREMTELYLQQLQTLWPHAGVVQDVKKGPNQRLYRMLFATRDNSAKRVADYVKGGGGGDPQQSLF